MTEPHSSRARVLGLPVDTVRMEEALARIEACIGNWRLHGPGAVMQIITVNAEMAIQARRNPELEAVFQRAGLVVPDGAGVVWALGRQGIRTPKVAGVDLLDAVAQRASICGWRLAFLGAAPGVAQAAANQLQRRYEQLQVVFIQDGFFKPEDEDALRHALRESKADVLFVALGVPRQEIWLATHQVSLGIPVAMGVGGSLDVISGRIRRAPVIFQRLRLEWFYRLLKEPWRVTRMRQTLPAFVWQVWREGKAEADPFAGGGRL